MAVRCRAINLPKLKRAPPADGPFEENINLFHSPSLSVSVSLSVGACDWSPGRLDVRRAASPTPETDGAALARRDNEKSRNGAEQLSLPRFLSRGCRVARRKREFNPAYTLYI